MRITMNGKNFEMTEALAARIQKKIGKLDRFFNDDIEANVRLSLERGARNICEVTIPLGSVMLRVEEVSNDMILSIDRAADKITRQIRRHRTKLEKKLRKGAFEMPEEESGLIPQEEESPSSARLARVKRFELKPMSVEDAIAQMDMLGHSFYMFLNDETNTTCVVYRRQDGDYGLLEPENA